MRGSSFTNEERMAEINPPALITLGLVALVFMIHFHFNS